MKDNILNKATDLFLNFGFKSVTMDEISSSLGISKKTIYANFENKTALVEASTTFLFEFISNGVFAICKQKKDPIEELYEIKKFVMLNLKDEKSSPQYQLQKYYPKLYLSLKKKQFDLMQTCVTANLERGIYIGIYRNTLNIEFIAKLYFSGMISIKNNDLFPLNDFSNAFLMEHFLEYHLRGICTEKGLKKVDEFTKR